MLEDYADQQELRAFADKLAFEDPIIVGTERQYVAVQIAIVESKIDIPQRIKFCRMQH